jgi:hypothetical protein
MPTMTFIEMGVHIDKARENNLFFEVNNGNIVFGGDCGGDAINVTVINF